MNVLDIVDLREYGLCTVTAVQEMHTHECVKEEGHEGTLHKCRHCGLPFERKARTSA